MPTGRPDSPAQETALVYCRLSTDEQTRGYNLPTQEESCRRYRADRGHGVAGEAE